MKECSLVNFLTPKGIELQGLWFGPKNASTVLIVIHGLSSSMFSNHELFTPLQSDKTAILFFNNRGHDKVTRVKKIDKRRKKGHKSLLAGGAHGVFTECADDIAGAISVAEKYGAKTIHLIGHSTGCQKAVYYQYKTRDPRISSLILLAPISDYAGIKKELSPEDLENLQKVARTLVTSGSPHTLLPQSIWPTVDDAQRFLSLATPDSPEELFSYSHNLRKPTELQRIKIPILVLLGEHDEYRDRPVKRIAAWFDKTIRSPHQIKIIPEANHSFTEHIKEVNTEVKSWISLNPKP